MKINKTYSEKLQDPRWQKKRLQILERDNWQCQYCNDTETQLQVHHLKYSGEPWEAKDEDLITTCADCHSLISHFTFSFNKIIKMDIKDKPGKKYFANGSYSDTENTIAVVYKDDLDSILIAFTKSEIEKIKELL